MKTRGITLDPASLTRKQLASVAIALGISPYDLKRQGLSKVENRKQAAMLRIKLERLCEPIR